MTVALWSAGVVAAAPPVPPVRDGSGDGPISRHVPSRPLTREQLDRLEAVKLYGQAALLEKKNQLVEAVRTLEAAARLDPDAAAPLRAAFPIYLALERTEDALAACHRVLELDPDDGETSFLYSRQLKNRGDVKEARAVLARATSRTSLASRPDLEAQVCFDLALLCEDAGDDAAAEKNLRRVTVALESPALADQPAFNREEIESQAADIWERLGRIYLKNGQTARALEAFGQARKRDPLRAARLSYNLAEVLARDGRAAEALERVDDYLRSQPQGIEGYELKMRLQRQLGREADVLPQLATAASRDRNNTGLRMLLAREHKAAGQVREAESVYQSLLRDSASAEVYRGLFELFRDIPDGGARMLTRFDNAVKAATEEKDGEQPRPGQIDQAAHARAMLQVLRGDAALVRPILLAAQHRLATGVKMDHGTRVLLAGMAARTRQLDLAERMYRNCLDERGQPRPGRDDEQEVYGGLLAVLRRSHKWEAIVEVCDRGLEHAQATNRLLFHLNLAEAYVALGRERSALAAADAAVAEAGDKGRLTSRLERAEVLSHLGKTDQAITECRALLEEYNQPGDLRRVRSVLSAVYSAARNYPRAEEQLKLVLESDSADATANNDLGYLWADQNKNLAEAERLVRKALELDREQRKTGTNIGMDAEDDNAAYVDSLGWVLYRRGRWKEARRELERASALPGGEEDPVVWDHLGDVYHRLGETNKAAAAWRKAVELYDKGARRRSDGRYDDVKGKLRLVEP